MSTDSESLEEICSVCGSTEAELSECENCRKPTCENCIESQVVIYSNPEGKGRYDVCVICSAVVASLEEYIEVEKIKWNVLTPRGLNWMTSCGAAVWAESQALNIENYSSLVLAQEDKEMIEKDVETGRSDPNTHNWQIRETLMRVIGDSYRKDIKEVLTAYCLKNSKVGYCQGMNIVTVWLLMFFDKNNAFKMLCYLIEKWLLPDFYIGAKHGNSLNGFYVESTVIASIIEHMMPAMANCSLSSSEFTDFFSLQHLIQLFVSTVDMESTVFLWDKLCEDGSIALIRGIVALILISEKAVVYNTHPLQIIKLLNENRIAPQVKQIYSTITPEITQVRVERLRKLARDLRAKQWLQCEKLVVKKLEHISNFSKDEIEQLQEKFNKLLKDLRANQALPKPPATRRQTIQLPQSLIGKMNDYQGSHSIGISKPQFLKLLQEIAPSMAEGGSELFDRFDEDGSGYLDFRELTVAMSVLSKGNFDDKLRICFDAYDINHTGYLQTVELQLLIEDILLPYSSEIEDNPELVEIKAQIIQIHQKMMMLSEQAKGKITFQDFANGIKADIFLYNCISNYIGNERPQVTRIFNAMNLGTFSEQVDEGNTCKCEIF